MFKKPKKQSRSDSTVDKYVQASIEGLQKQSAIHTSTWGFGNAVRYDVDLENGTIIFMFDDKSVEAPVNVIGTYDKNAGSFMWGWEHPSIPEDLQDAAKKAKKWGEENNVGDYTDHVVNCSEEDAWGFTAVAASLSDANGAYRGESGATLIYMTFGKITMKKL